MLKFRYCLPIGLIVIGGLLGSFTHAELPEHYGAKTHPYWGEEFPEYASVEEVQQAPDQWRDFVLQGEYVGTVDGQHAGLQLAALGNGQFQFILYPGGLPGDGWRVGTIRMFGTGVVEGDEIALTTERILSIDTVYPVQEAIKTTRYRFQIEPLKTEELSGPQCTLERTERGVIPLLSFKKIYRQSPTLGLASPKDAYVIFDGTNVDEFEEVPTGPTAPAGPPRVNRKRPDGVTLWAGSITKPKDKWWERPMTIHVEFLNTYRPYNREQARSNSGVFIAETYEVQILDSFGLESTKWDCGALYSSREVDVNVCYPPLVWQTFDIDLIPPKFQDGKKVAHSIWTMKFNGVVVHDRYEMVNKTPAYKEEIPEPRGTYFQPHENRVQFRNIWVQFH